MQCKDFESVLASEGFGPFSAEAREHLGGCLHCQDLLADIDSIVAAAKTFPAEVTPPARVWISLRAQLEAEGLIKEPAKVTERLSWWKAVGAWWKPRSLVSVGAALVLTVTAVFLTHSPQNARVANEAPAPKPTGAVQPSVPEKVADSRPAPALSPGKNSTPGPVPSRIKELAPSPSENASNTLSETELDVSNMQLAGNGNAQVDVSLRQNLRTLNEFIAECEQHLRKNPQDELAREYLNIAYQQKADLLAAMMESGRSEH